MIHLAAKGSFLRLLGSAIVSQAVLSGASLLVGLILIRRQSDAQYGYYVLVSVTLLLLIGLQTAFIQPSMVVRLARLDEQGRRELIGGLFREQRRILVLAGAASAILVGLLWFAGLLSEALALFVFASILAAMAALFRDFFRMVLLAYRRPFEVVACDLIYVVLLVPGAYLATFSPLPAATAVLTLALSAAVGGTLLCRAMWRHEPWNIDGAQSVLREFAPLGAWSVSGAAVHWTFSQGYTYLVAAMLDVQAVAAIAATRLLLMPVNLLSTGISQMMLPTAARWLHLHGVAPLYRRLLYFCVGVSVVALCYCAFMWVIRDWVFTNVLKKQFANRDTLLLLWSLIFLFMMLRDQLAHLLVVRGRMHLLTMTTFVSAALALTASFLAIRRFEVPGALIGVLIGEIVNVMGIVFFTNIESRRPAPDSGAASPS